MSSTAAAPAGGATGHGHSEAGLPEGILSHHFESLHQQNEAVRMGMWLFLATEVMLFAGLFCAYAYYRFEFYEGFAQASRHIDLWAGTLNTVILITSSLSVALALHFARTDRRRLAVTCLAATLLMGFAFLGIKSFEYYHKFQEGALPGRYYHFKEVQQAGAPMYFTIYFLATGLHAIHVIVGMTVLTVLMIKTARGRFSSRYSTGLEMGGLYWHLVDLIWIFLYPLLYLI